jgi:hypothetical protein
MWTLKCCTWGLQHLSETTSTMSRPLANHPARLRSTITTLHTSTDPTCFLDQVCEAGMQLSAHTSDDA